jgi:hypothetical protein
MLLNLEEEVLLPEDLAVLLGRMQRALLVAGELPGGDLAGEARGQADQPLGVCRQQLLVDARTGLTPALRAAL